jgi:ClpP class serine protease
MSRTFHIAQDEIYHCELSQMQRMRINAADLESNGEDGAELWYKPRPTMTIVDGIATIYVREMLGNGFLPVYEKYGFATSYNTIRKEIQQALTGGAQAIIFDIDSGGGACNGNIELARYISSLPVPTAAKITVRACSAAYAIASACDEIHAAISAQVGSIGVILSWMDFSKHYAELGIESHVMTNTGADIKGQFYTALTESQREHLQQSIDQQAELFWGECNVKRTLDEELKRGGWYMGGRALELGLIDEIIS